MTTWEILVAVHVVTTVAMFGVIWFVQIVHYPMLARYPAEMFPAIAKEHCDRTGFVVAPLMCGEAATGVLLFLAGERSAAFLASLLILAVIWISTAVLQVPLHRRLLKGFDGRALKSLVTTNWLRTAGWTARCGLLAAVFSAR